jgi:hypothetical protein
MNLTQSIDRLWTYMVSLVRSTQVCLGGGPGAADCNLIWKVTILAVVLVAAAVVLFVARRLLRDFFRHRAAIKRWKADQVVASDDVMDDARWKGDKAETGDDTQTELAAKIKEALRQNRDAVA